MNFIEWIVLGLVAGFIASKIINKTGEGLVMDIVLGIVGAVVGGFIVSRVPALTNLFGQSSAAFNLPGLIIAVLGAIIVLLIYHMLFRRRI